MLIKILLIVLSLILIGVGYILAFPQETVGQCWGIIAKYTNTTECYSDYLTFGRVLNNAGIYLLPIAALLFFASRAAFKKWTRFAVWFVPISALLIALQPERNVTLDPFLPGQLSATIWLGTLFLIVSGLTIFFGDRKK